jgi:hypothetical protein
MKLKDITHSSERWSTPLGTMDAHALVADGVLVALSLWGTSIIGLAVQCPDGKYFGSIRVPSNLYDQTFSLFGTTSLPAGDAADRCLSASPNYSPAVVLRYNAFPICISVLGGDVLSFYVATLAQRQPKCLSTGGLTSCIARR